VRSGRVMEKKRFLVAEADYHTDRPEHLVLGRGHGLQQPQSDKNGHAITPRSPIPPSRPDGASS
jgi:hypothetical protein